MSGIISKKIRSEEIEKLKWVQKRMMEIVVMRIKRMRKGVIREKKTV